MPLQKNVITIPLSGGLDTKSDPFQAQLGAALTLENARFQKTGSLSKRPGLRPLTTNTTTGDMSTKGIKAVVADNNAVHAITDDGVYSLSSSLNQWGKVSSINSFTKVSTEFASKSGLNQITPDCDFNSDFNLFATVSGEVFLSDTTPGTKLPYVVVTLEDQSTGFKKVKRIDAGGVNLYATLQKVMITNYAGAPRITVIYQGSSTTLKMIVLDKNLDQVHAPVTLATYTGSNIMGAKIDMCRDASNIFAFIMRGTALALYKFDLDGVQVATSSFTVTNALGLSTIGSASGFGASMCLTASNVHVFWISNTGTSPDSSFFCAKGFNKSLAAAITETATLADSSNSLHVDLSVVSNGTKIEMATANTDPVNTTFTPKRSWVGYRSVTFTTSYSFPTDDMSYIWRMTLISRPFIVGGKPYAGIKCSEGDQKSGFVLDLITGNIVSSFAPLDLSVSGVSGLPTNDRVTGTSNSVLNGSVALFAVEKAFTTDTNTITGADFSAYIATAKVKADFSIDYSSGTRVRVGDSLLYTNGPTLELDGRGAFENGFNLNPCIASVAGIVTGVTTAGVSSKTFSYIAVYEFFNGKGEITRSGLSTAKSITTASNIAYVQLLVNDLMGSFKNDFNNFTPNFSSVVTVYRTQSSGSTYYKVASVSSSPVGAGGYVTFYDAASDSDISNNTILYTTGGVLESGPTPNARFSTAGGNRLFLGGLEEGDEIAYSKKQLFGESVSFSGFYRTRISSGTNADKTPLSALGYMDGKLVIFRSRSIYYVAGDGPLETGLQNTFTEPEVVSTDVGTDEPRSVINIPNGLLFKSRKGIYLLDRTFQVTYVGAPVEEFNSEMIVSAIVSDKFNEARFYTNAGNCLVYNYLFEQWAVFKNQTIVDADNFQGWPVVVKSNVIQTEDETIFTDNGSPYATRLKTSWIKISGIQDFARIWSATILGKYKAAHNLVVKVRYNYDPGYVETYNIQPLVSDSQYQYRVHLQKQKCESIQFEIYDDLQTGESMELSALSLEVGLRKGSMKLPGARKY